jgi:hypothetical protein
LVKYARFQTWAEKREGGEALSHEGIHTILWLWRYAESVGWLIDRYIDHTGFDLAPD